MKGIFVDSSCDPVLEFVAVKKKKLDLDRCVSVPSEAEIDKQVNERMAPLAQSMPQRNLDPYQNPWMMSDDIRFSANMGNSVEEMYLQSVEDYYRDTLTSEALLTRYKPIALRVVNRGSKGCGKMRLRMTIVNGDVVYDDSKMIPYHDEVYDKPNPNQHYSRSIVVGPDFYLNGRKYDYYEENLEAQPVGDKEIKFTIDSLLQTEEHVLPNLYIDTTNACEVVIEWSIIEATLGKYGNNGKLKVIVH